MSWKGPVPTITIGVIASVSAITPALAQTAGPNAPPASLQAGSGSPMTNPTVVVPSMELAHGVTLEVTELQRLLDKGVMELRFVVMNRSPADISLKDLGLAHPGALKDIAIIDFAGRKQYSIGWAASCLCSTFRDQDGGVVRSGERREFWAWYGLPSAGARQMAIQVPDQPPLMNIPLL